MIDKAVAKLTGFGPQGPGTENRGQSGEAADATALGRLFQKHLSTLVGKADATGTAIFHDGTGHGQSEPRSRNDDDDYIKDRPEPTSRDAAAADERRERPHDSTTDAPREPARADGRTDDDSERSDAAAPQAERSDTSAHDDGRGRGGDEGEEPATAQDAGDAGGGPQETSRRGDGTDPAASEETVNAAAGTPAANGATAQTVAATAATTATVTAQVGGAAAAQGAGNTPSDGKVQQSQGQVSDTGKQPTIVAAQGEAPKTAGANAGNHGLGGNQANARNPQMPSDAGKPADTAKQAADPQARARQGQEISQAIGRTAEGSKVEVKVSTDMRGAGRGPTIATSQDGIAAFGSNATSGQAGGQTSGSNQQTAQAQLAQQQAAAQQQAQNQASQQVQPQNQQAGQRQSGAGPVATSPAAAGSGAGSGVSHGLQGDGPLQNAGASGSQSQPAQQAQSSAQTQAAQPQRAAQGGQAVADQVSVKITKAVQAGQDRIHIQLKPAELGRVDVRIEMTHDGRAVTIVTADKADTLDLMRRDAEQLQKALADAGLETGSGDLSFNLRGEGQEGEETKDTGAGSQIADGDDAAGDEAQSGDDGVMLALDSGILMPGHVDLRA